MKEDPNERTHELLARLYDEQGAGIYRYLLAMLGRPEDAEDVMQTVWMKLCRGLPQEANAEAYLWRSVRNEARRYYGLWRRRPRHEAGEALEMLPVETNPHILNGERLALASALAELPFKQREAIVLIAFEGLTAREVAARLGTSENTTASRYRLALAKLRRRMNRKIGP